MKIIITGGAGFVGSTLCLQLKNKYPTYEINAFKKQGYISILSEWLLDYNKDEIYFLVKHKKKYFLNEPSKSLK